MSEENPSIGIDLGTTNTVIGICQPMSRDDSKAENTTSSPIVDIITNSKGHRTTPSCVAFNEEECLVGSSAVSEGQRNVENTIYSSKRIIGRRFDDPVVQQEIKNWPFKVIERKGYPCYEVNYKSETAFYTPVGIATIILKEVKKFAEIFCGKDVKNVVITTPANFNTMQREATEQAAIAAGLHVSSILNEPVAAVIAYGLHKKMKNGENVLVFDIGGGTFDVSVTTMQNNILIVKAAGGDQHLGGENFNHILREHFIQKFNAQYKCDIRECKISMKRLYNACEKVKVDLSDSLSANLHEFGLFGKSDFSSKISRDEFEKLCEPLFQQTLESVKKVLKDADLDKSEIKNIILVGGSTRIVKIQQMLKDFFGKDLNKSLNPDEAVAHGAAIKAAMLQGKINKVMLMDVTPLSLGIEVTDGSLSVLIERNTPLPFMHTQKYTTTKDNQNNVRIKVYEGEKKSAKDNLFLKEFVLEGIPPAPEGVPDILVTFRLNMNAILEVSAVLNSDERIQKHIMIDRSSIFCETPSATDDDISIIEEIKS